MTCRWPLSERSAVPVVLGAILFALPATGDDQPPPPPAFEQLDRDADRFLNPDEAFPAGITPPQRRRFYLMDADGDGRLSPAEWQQQGRGVPRTAVNLFRGHDADEDGELTLEELLAGIAEPAQAPLKHALRALDFDGSSTLSFAEFCTAPALLPETLRGPLPDPIADLVAEKLTAVHAAVNWPVHGDQWSAAVRAILTEPIPLHSSAWDQNGDGMIDQAEVQAGLELAYGLARSGGSRQRFPNGRLFNDHFYRQLDRNGDRRLSKEELEQTAPRVSKTIEELLSFDRDGDQSLDMQELDAARLFVTDVAREFLRWDQNQDGAIDAAELATQARGWEHRIAERMVPAFDLNGDGRISLLEFRTSPLADGAYFVNDIRKDLDDDGVLSRAEFFPFQSLPFSGLAALYFERLDLNADGHLDRREATFDANWSRLPPDIVFDLMDRNANGQVDLQEAFALAAPSDELLHPNHAALFAMHDANGDGVLTQDELTLCRSLLEAREYEQALQQEARPAFARCDADGDGRVSLEEWRATQPASAHGPATLDFRSADRNADQRLDLLEFAALAGVIRTGRRIHPDALDEEVLRIAGEILKLAAGSRQTRTMSAAVRTVLPYVSPRDNARWDANADGRIDVDELRDGLDLLYGLREPDGARLRRSDGRLFDARWLASLDRNRNGTVERSEFTHSMLSAEELAAAFTLADRNADDRLTLHEATFVPWLWRDLRSVFRRLDQDGDGLITPAELTQRQVTWEQRTAALIFPAFDLDEDGALSVYEYQLSPLASAFGLWDRTSVDLDCDGQLSLLEFHGRPDALAMGLSALFFVRLDRDGSGSLSTREINFTVDLKSAPADVVFREFDINGDGFVTQDEIFSAQKIQHTQNWKMQTEDAFYLADADRDGRLNADEFRAPGMTVLSLATGRPLPPGPRGGRRPITEPQPEPEAAAAWDWKLIGLIAFNLLLVSGVGWAAFRPRTA